MGLGFEPIHNVVCSTKAILTCHSHVSRVGWGIGDESLRSTHTNNTCIGCTGNHIANQTADTLLIGGMSIQLLAEAVFFYIRWHCPLK